MHAFHTFAFESVQFDFNRIISIAGDGKPRIPIFVGFCPV